MTDVMVVAVHPDDETLGCGGTLLRHKEQGANIHLLLITAMYHNDKNGKTCTKGSDGKDHDLPGYYNFTNRHISFSKQEVKIKAEEISSVIKAYAFTTVSELRIPTTTVFLQDESIMVEKIAAVFSKVCPDILYIPFLEDAHGDHRAIFPILNSCMKTFRYPFIEKVYMMETISETEYASPLAGNSFIPNHFVCIDKWIDQKISIMETYKKEIQDSPFPRSKKMIRAQSRYRGAMAYCEHAEAFMLFKEIIR
ncbi:MAG: PIG-L family deacetylase [Desulfobacteraceae bacterium]|nr:PIG-L family deacetylase [Desulfobacteraceae bacterium]